MAARRQEKNNAAAGTWAFIIGVIIAVVLGLVGASLGNAQPWLYSLLIVLGLIVGFVNVTGKESKDFLFAAMALVIIAFVGGESTVLQQVQSLGPYLQGIFGGILALVVPAAIVVALKDIWALAYTQ